MKAWLHLYINCLIMSGCEKRFLVAAVTLLFSQVIKYILPLNLHFCSVE